MRCARHLLCLLLPLAGFAGEEPTATVLNVAKPGATANSGLLLQAEGAQYTADVTELGCLLRRRMVAGDAGAAAKAEAEGMVVRADDGTAIVWRTGVASNTRVRLLFGPVVTAWQPALLGKDGAVLLPAGWRPTVVRRDAKAGL